MRGVIVIVVAIFCSSGSWADESSKLDPPPSQSEIAAFIKKNWGSQFSAEDVVFVRGGMHRFTFEFKNEVNLQKHGVKIHVCKGAEIRFNGSEIWDFNTKSAGCKVGEYEAAAGTTITFSAGQSNFLTSIVTAKPVKARGREWPANSKLLFYFKDGGDIFVYAVVLGEDLKGTPYKKGDKVYIGSIMEEDDKMSDELSLSGEDPTC